MTQDMETRPAVVGELEADWFKAHIVRPCSVARSTGTSLPAGPSPSSRVPEWIAYSGTRGLGFRGALGRRSRCRPAEKREQQVRRIPVVDAAGNLQGIVSLADLIRRWATSPDELFDTLEKICEPAVETRVESAPRHAA